MKKVCLVAGFLVVIGVGNAHANEGSWFHTRTANEWIAGPIEMWVDHAWSESLSTTCSQNDMVLSWGPNCLGECYSNTSTGCVWARNKETVKQQWSWSENVCIGTTERWNHYGNCYGQAGNGNYLANQVCHQAANRSLNHTTIPFARYLNVSGAGLSFVYFFDCGAYGPGGVPWSCGC